MAIDVASSEEARVLDRELEKAQALYERLRGTEGKLKALKERTEELTDALAGAELAAGRSSPEAERLRRDLAKLAAEEDDLQRLELALLRAVSAQREQVDRARAVVDRLRAEGGAAEWRDLLERLRIFSESEAVSALRAAISRSYRDSIDGMPRGKGLWLPAPAELERMRVLTQENFARLRKDGYDVEVSHG